MKQEKNKLILMEVIAMVLLFICTLVLCTKKETPNNEENTNYVPSSMVDRSMNITLPAWEKFELTAGSKETNISFYNPKENKWQEFELYYFDSFIGKIVALSNKGISLQDICSKIKENYQEASFVSYDENFVVIDNVMYAKESDNFEGNIIVNIDNEEYKLAVTKKIEYYLLTFTIKLEDETVLYESDFIMPDEKSKNVILNEALEKGTYKAKVILQPYKKDKTKCNNGVVNILLYVK